MYLGLRNDISTCHDFPSTHNYCHKFRIPGREDLNFQGTVCLTNHFLDCPVFNGNQPILPAAAAAPLHKRLFLFIGLLALVCIFIGVVSLANPAPTASQGVNLLQILGSPTKETFQTPTAIPTATAVTRRLVIPPGNQAVEPSCTPTILLNLGFPLVIRQPTATLLPTQTFTVTPTGTSTPLPAEKKLNQSPTDTWPYGAPAPRQPRPAPTLEAPPVFRLTPTPPPIRSSSGWLDELSFLSELESRRI